MRFSRAWAALLLPLLVLPLLQLLLGMLTQGAGAAACHSIVVNMNAATPTAAAAAWLRCCTIHGPAAAYSQSFCPAAAASLPTHPRLLSCMALRPRSPRAANSALFQDTVAAAAAMLRITRCAATAAAAITLTSFPAASTPGCRSSGVAAATIPSISLLPVLPPFSPMALLVVVMVAAVVVALVVAVQQQDLLSAALQGAVVDVLHHHEHVGKHKVPGG